MNFDIREIDQPPKLFQYINILSTKEKILIRLPKDIEEIKFHFDELENKEIEKVKNYLLSLSPEDFNSFSCAIPVVYFLEDDYSYKVTYTRNNETGNLIGERDRLDVEDHMVTENF